MNSTRLTITAALLILTILAAGCISTDSVQEKTAAQGNQIDAKETPPKVDAPVEEAESAPVETHWYDDRPDFNPAIIKAEDNLFGVEIDGVKYQVSNGWYTIFGKDDINHVIFQREVRTHSNIKLYRELQPAQYKALIAECGDMQRIIMETIDTDGGGMDKVAVRYVGGKGVLEFETPFWDSGASISNYIMRYLVKGF